MLVFASKISSLDGMIFLSAKILFPKSLFKNQERISRASCIIVYVYIYYIYNNFRLIFMFITFYI